MPPVAGGGLDGPGSAGVGAAGWTGGGGGKGGGADVGTADDGCKAVTASCAGVGARWVQCVHDAQGAPSAAWGLVIQETGKGWGWWATGGGTTME